MKIELDDDYRAELAAKGIQIAEEDLVYDENPVEPAQVPGAVEPKKAEAEKTHKEVNEMNEENKDGLGGLTYPSMAGKGYDPVELERENRYPAKGSLYPKVSSGHDSVQIRHIPNFLRERLETAVEMGSLSQTLSHYIGQLEQAVDARTLRDLKNFQKEAEASGDHEDQKQVLKNITKYLRGMKMQKR